MSNLMVSVSGIRGVYGQSLTPEIVMKYAAHFGVFCQRGTVVIARDSRTTGELLTHAVISGLLSVGCNVISLGIASTPTLLLAVEQLQADGGICITASHNPAEWNALKLCNKNGMFLFPEDAAEFLKLAACPLTYAHWDKVGKMTVDKEATKRHIEKILSIPYINYPRIKNRRFKVVLDSVNGAGGTISPLLLSALNCKLIEINSEPSGFFAHNPEPLNQNLTQLKDKVRECKADIGFATDPDVDRLAIIDENGDPIGEELSLQLAAKYVLNKQRGDIVTNLSTSMALDDIASQAGVILHRTKVGEINVGKKMLELKSPIGGEGNGGIICPEVHYTRDAPAGMALILAYLAESEKTVSELVSEIPKYFFTKDKIVTSPDNLDLVMKRAEDYSKGLQIDKTDGLKIIGDKYWIHIRKSGTEPIVRIYVEADSKERSEAICHETILKIRV